MDQSEIQEVNSSQAAGDHFPLDRSCYKVLDIIGGGFISNVYKAICIPMNSCLVAIKIIELDKSSGDFDHVQNEAKAKLLSHPIILKPHCCFTVEGRLWVVMPLISSGSLRSMFACKFPSGLSEPCIATILRGVLIALSHLHGEGHSHGDIKTGKYFIDSDGLVRLGDFGFSATFYEPDFSCVSCGPAFGMPYWTAPEVKKSQRGGSSKADIWSFGVAALELGHGRRPLANLPNRKPLVRRLSKVYQFSNSFKEMVRLCLDKDPSKRPSPEQLFDHPFFKNCEGSDLLVKNVLQGLPNLEDRFWETGIPLNVGAGSSSNQRRITEWSLNRDTYELDPVYQEMLSITSDEDALVPFVDSDRTETRISTRVQRGPNSVALMASLVAMKSSLDLKHEILKELVSFTRSHDMGNAIREEEMRMKIDELTEELEAERQRRLDLEAEVENLTAQLSCVLESRVLSG
ncbi:UNVERIFIED_CONTAM: Serine/threonine-protein kinase BLUS1 [Sesamum radiatum]|uniref:Serine/threonine-protein kinase BLUS1 n=1 Tax=Sesamum radiatum TaxID=300843 RepID=A0AAW2UB23_SESRA